MTKEERLAYLDRAKEVELALPEGAEIIDVSINGEGYIQLFGESFHFRQFADSNGAEVQSCYIPPSEDCGEYIKQKTVLFGCETIYLLYPNNPAYEQELRLCGLS